ncbi:MAG TPA: RDD family protein [Steroidobacteraceae bacterium]|nr:RDD family protein [Steroidobacteraceae bacterium]
MPDRYDIQMIARVEYGGFWLRVLATLIDATILYIPIIVVEELTDSTRSLWLESLGVYGVWAVYCVPFWCSSWHATPGKRLCGLAILTEDGFALTLGRALLRYLADIISGLSIVGPFLVAFTERRQGLHDLTARTVVVKRSALAKVAIAV